MNMNIEKHMFYVPKKGEPIYIRSGFPHAPIFLWIGKTRAPLLQHQEAARIKNSQRRQPL
jgi:hypothetical protein